ncbi:SRPBCC family protein [Streptomyces muensis]|uniref:SRPBCC domain-containing protein n=1 Tax=Streptomyces muensis TaxID=1077944 RepID=A0A9X1PTN6_STRM4|nr:SRPBCC domain-containing protein [Streptomyces muensis]MCF1592325.1 SRPBCC domain-containing protein [Streptomyces muensis]
MADTPVPYVPYRLERTIEVPASLQDAWYSIATGEGITAWMLPASVDEFVGGRTYLNVDEVGGADSPGIVRAWDEPSYFVYEEYWATLAGKDQSRVTPLVNEFFLTTTDRDTRVIRVVTSAFGQGEAWERHFFEINMELGWGPLFEQLRLFLTHFPGERGARMFDHMAVSQASPTSAMATVLRSLGVDREGRQVKLHGFKGEVALLSDVHAVVLLDSPVHGMLSLQTFPDENTGAFIRMACHLYGAEAESHVKRESPVWGQWLKDLFPAAP